MTKPSVFTFKNYSFDKSKKKLVLNYAYDNGLEFSETYTFDFDFVNYDSEILDRALQHLFFVAGVSYYKTFIPSNINVHKGDIDENLAQFLNNTYQKGLGEFFYSNKLDPDTQIDFPINTNGKLNTLSIGGEGMLIAIGGGKDSLLSVELLRDQPKIATWSLGHKDQLSPLIDKIGLTHFWVERQIDKQLFNIMANPQAYGGHIPISAIFACVGTIVCLLTGYRDNVVSNESSADEETLTHKGVKINHQYSKSSTFEKSYQKLLTHNFGEQLRYYSLLRSFGELYIAELFSKYFDKYKTDFSSCNRAFMQGQTKVSWCGECAKCAFVFLALAPFVDKNSLKKLYGGKNLLQDKKLELTYKQLLGVQGNKPLDCVGEVRESRVAMQIAQSNYPEISKFKFDLPKNYNYRELKPNLLPPEINRLLHEKHLNI